MNTSILYIDIETVPLVYNYADLQEHSKVLWDQKWKFDPEINPESYYQKAGIYAEFAKIICISTGNFNKDKFYVKSFYGHQEEEILRNFNDYVSKFYSGEQHNLCAHNGKEFDFPFICRRTVINRLPLPSILDISSKKPWEVKLLDTMEMWKFGDYKNFTSLSLLAHVFGIPTPKDDINGADVARVYYEDKDIERIKNYCTKDVVTLARVHHRLKGLSELQEDQIVYVTN